MVFRPSERSADPAARVRHFIDSAVTPVEEGYHRQVADVRAAGGNPWQPPDMAQELIDFAMQIHCGGGMSDDFPLAGAWTTARALRLADGPDEVHRAHRAARAGQVRVAMTEVAGVSLTDEEWLINGHTQNTNPAFRHFWLASIMLEVRCRRILRQAQRGGSSSA